MKTHQKFNLAEGIDLLKKGMKIRKTSWNKTFSWIEYDPVSNCLIKYDAHGLSINIYKDVDLDNPGNNNNLNEKVWEIYHNDSF